MEAMASKARTMLEQRKSALGRLAAQERAEAVELRASAEDFTDTITLASEETLGARLSQREREELAEIDAALSRIEKGSYGRCELCGRAIGRARLAALPTARLCVGCSA